MAHVISPSIFKRQSEIEDVLQELRAWRDWNDEKRHIMAFAVTWDASSPLAEVRFEVRVDETVDMIILVNAIHGTRHDPAGAARELAKYTFC